MTSENSDQRTFNPFIQPERRCKRWLPYAIAALIICWPAITIHVAKYADLELKNHLEDLKTLDGQIQNAGVLYARHYQNELQHGSEIVLNGATHIAGPYYDQTYSPSLSVLQSLKFLPTKITEEEYKRFKLNIERYPNNCIPEKCHLRISKEFAKAQILIEMIAPKGPKSE